MAKLFPDIIAADIQPAKVQLTLHITPDIHYFAGHFPDTPILAGVTQLHYYPHLTEVTATEVLKFQVMIKPDSQLTLVLEHQKEGVVQFSYLQQGNKVASGRLKWEQTANV